MNDELLHPKGRMKFKLLLLLACMLILFGLAFTQSTKPSLKSAGVWIGLTGLILLFYKIMRIKDGVRSWELAHQAVVLREEEKLEAEAAAGPKPKWIKKLDQLGERFDRYSAVLVWVFRIIGCGLAIFGILIALNYFPASQLYLKHVGGISPLMDRIVSSIVMFIGAFLCLYLLPLAFDLTRIGADPDPHWSQLAKEIARVLDEVDNEED